MLQSVTFTDNDSILPSLPTILLVEDEPFVREATRNILANAGFPVLAAENAAEAMRVYQNCHCSIDLLMTDLVLPGCNGLELGREIRRRSPEVVVLVTSGYGSAEYDTEDPSAQTYFLAKPYSRCELLGKIGAILGQTAHCAACHAS